MKTKILLFFSLFLLALYSCNNESTTATDLLNDSLIAGSDTGLTESMVLEIITTIPNPVEMSSLLYKSKVKFSPTLLNPAENVSKYNINYKKAINMGVYGADLVHMNIYDRTTSALLYLNSIQQIAKDLGVEKFFDAETLNKLSENSKNTDSVLLITSVGFDRMNQFLQQNNRTNISVLIGVGTWIESLYLATNCEQIGNKDLVYQRIGDQKFVIENIILMVDKYKKDPNINGLLNDMKKLKDMFAKLEVKYEYKEPTTEIVNGMPVVTDNSTSKIVITDDIFKKIGTEVKIIRTRITQ
ncbi:MAG: hypothetical protein WCK02_11885 [Bacteroidota bacterium]